MRKSMKNGGAAPQLCREIAVCALDQIRGGAIVISDPGGAGNVTGPSSTGARNHPGSTPH